ncbi:hypothetical protein KVR01_008166 [Diaporthe batatas]|uniref:uncharacterized protein n=1 Tax=Diaporthe batatas TaxID=748121 RepID=UPI001D0469B8|nr:uncharacterized protein KVR01_008166 [Diaporthe batatas]KAG8162401.1 hypothetical protein KVR01_008166 [Diaporthe batatas]
MDSSTPSDLTNATASTHLLPRFSTYAVFTGCFVIYLLGLAIYRLYLTPSAKFPGPRLAALCYWYEFYYDVWPHEGQYTWKIRDLHEKYGPFVRINPCEVHCNDPDFFNTLYVSSAKRTTDKWIWAVRQSWTRNSSFKTLSHDLHKRRRNQVAPFFSKSSIRRLEPLIINKVNKLCERLEAKSQLDTASNKVVNLTHAFMALTGDVISTVCFGQPTGFLDLEDLGRDWYEGRVVGSRSNHLLRQFPWLFLLPLGWISGGKSRVAASLQYAQQKQKELRERVTQLVDEHDAKTADEKLPAEPQDNSLPATVFVSMLEADVPPSEKNASRLTEEAFTLTGAGTMTTANALNSIVYYVLSRPDCLARLKDELRAAFPDPSAISSSAELERLPVSPFEDYSYSRPDGHVEIIPHGVPVGMSFIDILEDEEIFPDPHAFKPERWLPAVLPRDQTRDEEEETADDPVARRRKWAVSTVFGGGSRMCIGLHLAWSEMYLTVATLVSRFGDRMELYDVEFERDIKVAIDGFDAFPGRGHKGLRVTMLPE